MIPVGTKARPALAWDEPTTISPDDYWHDWPCVGCGQALHVGDPVVFVVTGLTTHGPAWEATAMPVHQHCATGEGPDPADERSTL